MSLDLSLILGDWPSSARRWSSPSWRSEDGGRSTRSRASSGAATARRSASRFSWRRAASSPSSSTPPRRRAASVSPETTALLTAAVIVSMALTPLAPLALTFLLADGSAVAGRRRGRRTALTGTALVIGFGRFGQVASQALLARGIDVSIIDSDTEMIRVAARFGFKIYYGDGTRLDVLRAAGAGDGQDHRRLRRQDRTPPTASSNWSMPSFRSPSSTSAPSTAAIRSTLIGAGVDYEIRETFESAMAFGEAALRALGVLARGSGRDRRRCPRARPRAPAGSSRSRALRRPRISCQSDADAADHAEAERRRSASRRRCSPGTASPRCCRTCPKPTG